MSTPSVLLSTHCALSKSLRVKAAALKVKMHLVSGLFVQGCHYAGCDQATKFSSKINQPPPHPLCSVYPQGDAPPCSVSSLSLHPISGRGPAPCLFSFHYPLICILLLFFYPCALLFLITLTHFKVLHPPRSLLFLDTPILHGSFPLPLIFNLLSLYLLSDLLSSLHLFFNVS